MQHVKHNRYDQEHGRQPCRHYRPRRNYNRRHAVRPPDQRGATPEPVGKFMIFGKLEDGELSYRCDKYGQYGPYPQAAAQFLPIASHRRGATKIDEKAPHTRPMKIASENFCSGSAPKK